MQLQGREPEEESSQASNHKLEVDNSPDKEGTADSSVEMTEPPVYKSGYLAVCNHCGITSEDFNRCARCHHKLPEEVKQIPMGEVYGNDKTNDMLNAHQTLHDKKGSLIPKNMRMYFFFCSFFLNNQSKVCRFNNQTLSNLCIKRE